MTFKTMRAAIRANREAGSFFFHPDTMKFWESIVHHSTWDADTGLFITSERLSPDERVFTIRQLDYLNPKNIDTHARFRTMEEAVEQLRVIKAL